MEIYYRMLELCDWYAMRDWGDKDSVIKPAVSLLLTILEGIEEGNDPQSVGDANDCGSNCKTWEDVLDGFKELWENGERIPIK